MGRVVLVTGVSTDLGGRVARHLAADSAVERVIGVDVVPPAGDLGPVSFVRADIRNPVIAKVIAGQEVDTVVHLSVRPSGGSGARSAAKEHNVIGTMQLLAACQKAPGLERLVVRSSAAVYGSSSRDPAMFTEDMAAKRVPRSGFAKDVLEVEGYVRGFARRRPDVAVTMLRPANLVGRAERSPFLEHLLLPVVPTPLGFDARFQVLHEDDLIAAVAHATLDGCPRHLQRRRTWRAGPFPGPAAPGTRADLGAGSRAEQPRWSAAPGRSACSVAGADRLPDVRASAGHQADDPRARLRAPLHHRGSAGRRRRRANAWCGSHDHDAGRDAPLRTGAGRGPAWLTQRSSPSEPVAVPDEARAAASRPRPPEAWPAPLPAGPRSPRPASGRHDLLLTLLPRPRRRRPMSTARPPR